MPASRAGTRSSDATTSCSSTGPAAATATTIRRGSSATRRSERSSACAVRPSPRKAFVPPDDDCLFCTLYREGDHVASIDGFVAIRDINLQAATHLLVIPEHHIASFHEIAQYDADEDKRMLDFVAAVAAS